MSSTKTLLKYVCIFLSVNSALGNSSDDDDLCPSDTGNKPMFRLQSGCLDAIRDPKTTELGLTQCGFEGNTLMLCCPNSRSNVPNVDPNKSIPQNGQKVPSSAPNDKSKNNEKNGGDLRKSQLICAQYRKQIPSGSKCVHDISLPIDGGVDALVGEFPHMAAIGFQPSPGEIIQFFCGGSLISEYYVLTSGSCTSSRMYGRPNVVRLGDYDIERSNDGVAHKDFLISNITTHPEFKFPSQYYDIALLRLNRKVQFSKMIRPACLWSTEKIDQKYAVAAGWGAVEESTDETKASILQKVALEIIDNSRCAALPAYAPMRKLAKGIVQEQLCAGDLESGGKDTCRGDGGGPLQITDAEDNCITYLIGIISFGKGCGAVGSPGVNTRVSSYVDWIEGIVWPQ